MEMPEDQLAEVVAYAVHLRHQRDVQARAELARKIDDQDPSHWVSIDQLREHWGE
jgi:HAMP domain-containing protein